MAEVAELKTTMPELELAAKTADEELAKELAAIPNLPLDEVPEGVDEHGNVQRHVYGKIRNYAFRDRSRMTISAARSATWISRPPRNCAARASSC